MQKWLLGSALLSFNFSLISNQEPFLLGLFFSQGLHPWCPFLSQDPTEDFVVTSPSAPLGCDSYQTSRLVTWTVFRSTGRV